MSDKEPQNNPQPQPESDWNALSVQEIEQTLNNAADLAYELAGNVGAASSVPGYRDMSGLESVETTLEVELKQLEHLVDRTREELSENPLPDAEKKKAAAVPDFMSEFLSDEPAPVMSKPRDSTDVSTESQAVAKSGAESGSGSARPKPERHGHPTETISKPGLVGVGTLGRTEPRSKSKPDKSAPVSTEPRSTRSQWLKSPLYCLCEVAIGALEVMNRPFVNLNPATQRALSVTAIAAFCMCLAMFLLSLLMS